MKWLNGDHQKAVRYTGLKNKGRSAWEVQISLYLKLQMRLSR